MRLGFDPENQLAAGPRLPSASKNRSTLFRLLNTSAQRERVNVTERKLHLRWNGTFPAWTLGQYDVGLRTSAAWYRGSACFYRSDEQGTFYRIFETILLPTLRKGDMVLMDNLSSHKGLEIEMLLASKGASALYLPAYSPDLNPIELSFSKLKSLLRKLKIREVGKLQRFLRKSPRLFSADECQNYFRHAGYGLN